MRSRRGAATHRPQQRPLPDDAAKIILAGRAPSRPMRYSHRSVAGTLLGRRWAWRLCSGAPSLPDTHAGNAFDPQEHHQPLSRIGCGAASRLWGICCRGPPLQMVGAWLPPCCCNRSGVQWRSREFFGMRSRPWWSPPSAIHLRPGVPDKVAVSAFC